MSVLQGLKGTFKGVQQDIVDGLKALTSFEGHPKTETLKKLRGDGVHLDAGADLLYRYQKTWEDIDQNNKENARQAKVVDDKVNDIFKSWEKQAEVMTNLEDSVQHVPDLLQVLSQLTQTLSEVKEEFKKVEDALDELEDVCDEEELQRQMMSHTLQLQQYQQTRYSDVEKVKVTLAKEHAKRMQEIERDRSEKLQERQNAFEEAFTNDLSFYKQHGRADKLELPEMSKVASLSEITIEQDQTALDDFLASQTTTPLTDTGPDATIEEVKDDETKDEEEEDEDGDVIVRDAEDLGEEGTFIEDDYTEDFSHSETSGLHDELNHLHAKLEHSDISYRSTFDTDSVEREDGRDKVSHLTTKDETTHLDSKDETTHQITKDETTRLSTKDEKTKDETTHLKTKDETTQLKTKDEMTHLKTKDETARLTIKDEITDDVKDKPNTDKDSGCDSPNPNNVQENESITGKDWSGQADNDDNDPEDSSKTITDDVQSSDTKEESDKVETDSEISQDCDSKTGHSQIGDSENRDSKNDDS